VKNILRLGLLLLVSVLFPSLSVRAQDSEQPRYRSRAELRAARQNLQRTFPEEMQALRALHLPPEKAADAELKLRRSEAATRGAREELQALLQQDRQGYNHRSSSERANELRTSLEQAKEQLHSDLKTLLTAQQQQRFEQRLQKERRKPAADGRKLR
jgi:hypothetical protein